jgi:hypothetical protein
MTSNYIYHYVYRITNLITRTHYYGVRSCNIHPTNDIGVKYFGSLTKDEGKYFRIDQRANPQNFRYKIVRILPTREAANTPEIIFHHKFDVGINPKFYNKAKALSTGFDVTGRKGRKMDQCHKNTETKFLLQDLVQKYQMSAKEKNIIDLIRQYSHFTTKK